MHNWFVYDAFSEAEKAAADFIAEKIQDSIQKNNICHIALPGGNTPAACLGYLSEKKLSWNKVHWYLGDERCYPVGHQGRNDVMLEKNLWCRLPSTNIYRIPAEKGAEKAAAAYRKLVDQFQCFDIIFLGMGEDGHTASLFPGNRALEDMRSVIAVHDSPKEPDDRVSLSVSTIQKARCRIVLTGGQGKSEVLARVKAGEKLPVNSVGDINWYVDQAAMGRT